jgi:hypothetical protein
MRIIALAFALTLAACTANHDDEDNAPKKPTVSCQNYDTCKNYSVALRYICRGD